MSHLPEPQSGKMTAILFALLILPSALGTFLPPSLIEKKLDKKAELKQDFGDKLAVIKDIKFNITNKEFWEKAEKQSKTEDAHLSFTELTAKYGYHSERHNVTTDDGFILAVYRLKGKDCTTQKKIPVIILHGVLDTGRTWIITGPKYGLGYLVADQGYDVWIPSFRGTNDSLGHVKYSSEPSSEHYWDWSLDQYGSKDLKGVIDYVLKTTGKPKVHFVGHSVGTTAFFILCSEKPEYNDKIAVGVQLAAVAYAYKTYNPIIQLTAGITRPLKKFGSLLGFYELLCQRYSPIDKITKAIADISPVSLGVGLMIGAGGNPALFGLQDLTNIFNYYPDGISTKGLVHFDQLIAIDKFSKYYHDDPKKNIAEYGSLELAEYDLTKVTCPIAIVAAEGDLNSILPNVAKIKAKLPNVVHYKQLGPEWGHAHYVWAKTVPTELAPTVFEVLNKYDDSC